MLGLRRRFEQETTYTRVGPVLMAVNPNRVLPEKPGPHVTDVALAAMRGAVDEGRSQAVVISGESGAGKTVSATKIIEFLISRSSHDTGRKSFERRELAKEELLSRLKASIPALEALGNAGTALNENSSRFGKLVKLTYDGAGRARDVVGAHVEEFLLEKARVARRARGAGERNYHFLCQLAAAAGAGATYAPPATLAAGDVDALVATEQSFRDCGVPWDDLKLLRTVGEAVLRLGDDDVDGAARRLSVEPDALRRALAQRTCAGAGVGDADVGVPYEPVERTRVVDALAKALYAALFSAAVAGVNAALARPLADCRPPGAAAAAGAAPPPPPGTAAFVGILDIYGFEIFAANGLDQLLINFANEVLQRNFDDCLLAAEAARYDADAVPWASLDLARTLKSSAIVDLVTKAPRGLLPLLDEQVKLGNRGSDAAFLTQADKAHRASGVYAKPRLDRNAFVVAHYAGAVTYDPAGFLLSNSDPLPADVAAVFARSANPGVAALVAGASSGDKAAPGGLPSLRDVARASAASHAVVATLAAAAPRKALPQLRESTSRVFRGQMKQLEATLASCAQPAHYVRCVRPNAAKRADRFDAALVLRQLRASGIMDLVKIRALGFPERVSAKAFAEEFAPRADAAEARALDAALAAAGGAGALLEARAAARGARARRAAAVARGRGLDDVAFRAPEPLALPDAADALAAAAARALAAARLGPAATDAAPDGPWCVGAASGLVYLKKGSLAALRAADRDRDAAARRAWAALVAEGRRVAAAEAAAARVAMALGARRRGQLVRRDVARAALAAAVDRARLAVPRARAAVDEGRAAARRLVGWADHPHGAVAALEDDADRALADAEGEAARARATLAEAALAGEAAVDAARRVDGAVAALDRAARAFRDEAAAVLAATAELATLLGAEQRRRAASRAFAACAAATAPWRAALRGDEFLVSAADVSLLEKPSLFGGRKRTAATALVTHRGRVLVVAAASRAVRHRVARGDAVVAVGAAPAPGGGCCAAPAAIVGRPGPDEPCLVTLQPLGAAGRNVKAAPAFVDGRPRAARGWTAVAGLLNDPAFAPPAPAEIIRLRARLASADE